MLRHPTNRLIRGSAETYLKAEEELRCLLTVGILEHISFVVNTVRLFDGNVFVDLFESVDIAKEFNFIYSAIRATSNFFQDLEVIDRNFGLAIRESGV